jgi:hypothetical protein
VKVAVGRLSELGVSITPDDVSTCLVGSESALFEAPLPIVLARARQWHRFRHATRSVGMQATVTNGAIVVAIAIVVVG